VLLTVHALVMISGLLACALANRLYSPERFWVQWVALGWGTLFLIHLMIFTRGTLATMGGKKSGGPGGSELHAGKGPDRGRIEERFAGSSAANPGTERGPN